MSTNDNQDQGVTLLGALRSVTWPMVATLALAVALLVVGPRFGVDVDKALATVAALLAAGGFSHSRTAARQTNGVLDERMRSAVARGIAEALDGQPPAAQPAPATYGGAFYEGTATYPPESGLRG